MKRRIVLFFLLILASAGRLSAHEPVIFIHGLGGAAITADDAGGGAYAVSATLTLSRARVIGNDIDTIARLGVRFDNAYTPSPICVPVHP